MTVNMRKTILTLPTEMLAAILDEVPMDKVGDFRELRLVCKDFANNYSVLSRLFYHINLVADVTWLEQRAKAGAHPHPQHINSVRFVPPLYNWHMTLDVLHESLEHAWETDQGPYDTDRLAKVQQLRIYDETARDGRDEIPDQHNRGMLSRHTHEQEASAFDRYMAVAARNRTLIETEGTILIEKWISYLKSSRATSVRFAHVNPADFNADLEPDYPLCVEEDLYYSDPSLCSAKKNLADATHGLALAALMKSQIKIESIAVTTYMHLECIWANNLRNAHLVLRNVKHIGYTPAISSYYDDFSDDAADAIIAPDVSYLDRQCGSQLESIHVRAHGLKWPDDLRLSTNVREIHLESCGFTSGHLLASWITDSASLKNITLHNVLFKRNTGGWRSTLDAIRAHPSTIKVWIHGGRDDSFRAVHKGGVRENPSDGRVYKASKYYLLDVTLALYLNGCIEWVDELRRQFGD